MAWEPDIFDEEVLSCARKCLLLAAECQMVGARLQMTAPPSYFSGAWLQAVLAESTAVEMDVAKEIAE